jgi:hypothetical protein
MREFTVEQLMLELEGALAAIEFMHGCLTEKNHKYAYPEMTVQKMKRLRKLVGERHGCVHSSGACGCPAFVLHQKKQAILHEASERVGIIQLKDEE